MFMSLHANQPAIYSPLTYPRVPDSSTACLPRSTCAAQRPLAQLSLKEHSSIRSHSLDPLPVNLLATGSPAMGMTLMVGSFSVLLVFFWLRVCRLTSVIRRRDQCIKKLLAIDSLTSVSNRETLLHTGEQLLLTFPDAEVVLLSINVHRFKSVNDEFGHVAGDELLQQIARRLKTCIGPQDTLARMGDDQFSLLLNPYYDAPDQCGSGRSLQRAEIIAQRLLSVLHQPFYIQSHVIGIEASLGIAVSARQVPSVVGRSAFGQLLSQSMVALDQSKKMPTHSGQARSHRYVFFDPEMAAKRSHQAQMRRELAQVIEQQGLRIRYQPIVRLQAQTTVGFEALVRWQHPTLGLLSPDRFLPLAEEMGLMVEIDRWVLEAACQQLLQWRAEDLYPSVSVNLSGAQLGRSDVAAFVRSLLSRYDISPSQLNLEVTESVLIEDSAQAIKTLRQLKHLGLRLSLDDFGTGYSSLEYLHQFPVDVLKIDKSFISTMRQAAHQDPTQDPAQAQILSDSPSQSPALAVAPSQAQNKSSTQIIVRSILALAQGLDLEVVAEGIEYDDQCAELRQMQCTYGQGNFFAAPMTSLSAGALLKRTSAQTTV